MKRGLIKSEEVEMLRVWGATEREQWGGSQLSRAGVKPHPHSKEP